VLSIHGTSTWLFPPVASQIHVIAALISASTHVQKEIRQGIAVHTRASAFDKMEGISASSLSSQYLSHYNTKIIRHSCLHICCNCCAGLAVMLLGAVSMAAAS